MTDAKICNQGWSRMVFAAPAEIVRAAEAAASQDYSSVSQIIRQALAGELKRRGLLAERV
jgi:hypothetical protein